MRRAVVLSIVPAMLTLGARAQEPVFRAGARTVPIYATVRDRDGHLVTGLERSDFQVIDDGRVAQLTTFSNDVLPASIALMLDMSTSMIGEQLRVRDSALHFIDVLLSGDRVRIGTFGEEIALSPLVTSDKRVLGRVLREEVWPGGETPLWSALRAAMASLAGETNRRVIVILTDGIDTGCPRMIGEDTRRPPERHASSGMSGRSSSRTTKAFVVRTSGIVRDDEIRPGRRTSVADEERQLGTTGVSSPCASLADVEKLALESDFMVYAVGMEGPGLAGGLLQLVDETGGGRFELKRNADLTTAFSEVADELHHQYALGVTPVALDGRVHTLEVRLAGSGLTARARRSYLAVER